MKLASPTRIERLLALRESWRKAHQQHQTQECDRLWMDAVSLSQAVLESTDPALLERIPPSLTERLSRDGREWERLLVQVAAAEKASFGAIEYEIDVGEASKFHQWIEFELTSLHGGVLFTESASLDAYHDGRWSGRTYCFFPDACRNWSLTPLESFTGLAKPPRLAKLMS